MKTSFIVVLLFAIIIVFTLFSFTYYHERVHVAIYNSFGIESKVELFPAPKVTPLSPYRNSEYYEIIRVLHSVHEVYEYQLLVLIVANFVCMFLIVNIVLANNEINKKLIVSLMEEKNVQKNNNKTLYKESK